MEQTILDFLSRYDGVTGALLLLAIIIWQIIKAVNGRGEPTHGALESHMAACEDRIQRAMSELKSNIAKVTDDLNKVDDNVVWLREVHDRRDEDGIPLWYNKRSLETKLVTVADSVDNACRRMERLCELLEEQNKSKYQ